MRSDNDTSNAASFRSASDAPSASPLDPELRRAYEAACYRVATEAGPVELAVGGDAAPSDRLLAALGVRSAAIVTAANPGSLRLDETENGRRHEALAAALHEAGNRCFASESRAVDGDWRERGFLVAGIARGEARSLAAAFGQAALLWLEVGRSPAVVAT